MLDLDELNFCLNFAAGLNVQQDVHHIQVNSDSDSDGNSDNDASIGDTDGASASASAVGLRRIPVGPGRRPVLLLCLPRLRPGPCPGCGPRRPIVCLPVARGGPAGNGPAVRILRRLLSQLLDGESLESAESAVED